jgi:diguanylate cyclase
MYRVLKFLLCLYLLNYGFAMAQLSAPTSVLTLSDDIQSVKPWPYVHMYIDSKESLNIQAAIAQPELFTPTQALDGALGSQKNPVWLRIPIRVSAGGDPHWIVDVDYQPITKLDFFLVRESQIEQSASMGNVRAFELRPLKSRSYAMPVELKAGQDYVLYIRAQMQGGMVLPLTLHRPPSFLAYSTAEQMLQGLIIGIGLCLIVYSLGQWLSLRESLFAKYALLTFGSLLFCTFLFGIGTQFLWKNNTWMESHIGVLAALCASIGSFLFNEHSLRGPGVKPWFAYVMKGGAVLGTVLAVIYSLDIFDNRTMTAIISLIGTVPALLGIPVAAKRALERDPLGVALVFAWLAYGAAAAVLIALFAGKLPANFWTVHSFEIGATIDMFVFMYVLSLRTRAVRLAANRASQERDVMRSLAHTDPLTGLANRRSLNESLEAALRHSSADNMLAVYVIDVDGFKPVNDRYGHDTGDELLVSIARRLKSHTRNSDVVARVGGDEFVIIANGIREQRLAFELGTKLVDVFNEPFQLRLGVAHIGLTIGYALAPVDAADATSLLKVADAAMYEGKQEGKRCLRRAKPAAPIASSRFKTVPSAN